MPQGDGTVMLEDAEILWPNFSGREGPFNQVGERGFSVVLPADIAAQMAEDGWNVKQTKPREEGDEPKPFVDVAVKYGKGRDPRIVMVTSRGRTTLDEGAIELLDYADIRVADMILNPSKWDVNGRNGIKAYLKTMFVTIEEDALERKYAEPVDEPR